MSKALTRLRGLGKYLAYGPEYDATAVEGLRLSPWRLSFIGLYFLSILPSLDWRLASGWCCAMFALEFGLRRVLKQQIAGGTRITRRLRIVGSLMASTGWVGIAAMCWINQNPDLRLAALALWTGMFLYAQSSCSKFPAHFVLTGGPPVLAVVLAPLLTPAISIQARITVEGAVILCLVHTLSSALTTFIRHRQLERTGVELIAQRQAAEAASQAKSDFLAMMSHELRTPLNGVLGLAHALGATGLTAKQHNLLEGITRSGDGLMSILNDILDLTKIEAGRMEIAPSPTDIHALVEDIRRLFAPAATAKAIDLQVSIEAAIPQWILIDALRVKQVVANLVSNALKFTEQGEVRLSLCAAYDARIGMALFARVDDTGPGLTPAARDTLFQRFSQGHGGIARTHGGTGLGLAISRDLAQAMNGDLTLLDRPGPGASFELILPLRTCAQPAQPLPLLKNEPASGDVRTLSILVVEDNAMNRSVVQALLEPTGWRLAFADNGASGLEALAHGAFDLVLMDIHMPIMDGLKALVQIRAGQAGDPNIPVIALTADAMAGNREQLIAAGFDGYVEKPIRPHLLLEAIQAALLNTRGDGADEDRIVA
jgi:signal transduction histidine kinase/ActR/RegA family two-component response regulator